MRSSAFGDSNHPGALACGQTGGIHQDRAMDKNSIASSWVKGGPSGLGNHGNHGMFVEVEIGCYVFLVFTKFYPFYIQFLVVWMIGCISFLPFLYSCRCYDLNERKDKKSITHLFSHSSLNYPGHLFDPLPEPKKMSLGFDCHLFFTERLTKFYGFPDFHGSFLRYPPEN